MNVLIGGILGALVGAAGAWIVMARQRSKSVMFEEIERDARFSMRRALGHVFPAFSETIRLVSPQCCSIYEQASDAEQYGLDQVCGVAYGRAIEFLIKDYAKQCNPSAADKIEISSLASCIQKFIPDAAIRESADLARWARNDETHYTRHYAGRDIKDLKRVVTLTIALIENAEQRKALEQEAQQEKDALDGKRKPDTKSPQA